MDGRNSVRLSEQLTPPGVNCFICVSDRGQPCNLFNLPLRALRGTLNFGPFGARPSAFVSHAALSLRRQTTQLLYNDCNWIWFFGLAVSGGASRFDLMRSAWNCVSQSPRGPSSNTPHRMIVLYIYIYIYIYI